MKLAASYSLFIPAGGGFQLRRRPEVLLSNRFSEASETYSDNEDNEENYAETEPIRKTPLMREESSAGR